MRNLGASLAKLHPSKKTILLTVAVAAVTLSLSAAVSMWLSSSHNLSFPSVGNILTIGVEAYWDAGLENKTQEIQWGTSYPGSVTNATIYLLSRSTIDTTLRLRTANWTFLDSEGTTVFGPSNSTPYMNLTWSYNGTAVKAGEGVQVTLTLAVDDSPAFVDFLIANGVKEFSFDITMTASDEAA